MRSGGKHYMCSLCGKVDGHNVNMKENINRKQAFKKFLENGVVNLTEE